MLILSNLYSLHAKFESVAICFYMITLYFGNFNMNEPIFFK